MGLPSNASPDAPAGAVLTVPDEDGMAVHYYPWTDGRAVGYRVLRADGAVEYIYFNPSDNEDSPGAPNVFVYTGAYGDPNRDTPHVHFVQDFDAWEHADQADPSLGASVGKLGNWDPNQ